MKEDTQGNPQTAEDTVFGSASEDFFSALEDDVNSIVQDDKNTGNVQNKETSTQSPNTIEQKSEVSQENSEVETLKKRYSDSSREAQKLKAQLNELKPFVPVLDAMKNDGGLIEHVRDYLNNGGNTPKNIKESLKLDEDFVFDSEEMVNNPDSDSAKVFNSMVDRVVQQRTGQMMEQQKRAKAQDDAQHYMRQQAFDFQKRHSMNDEQFSDFVKAADKRFKEKGMSFDDMYAIMNQGAVSQNVANSTKEDMLNQMKNVRDIPKSQGSANNAGSTNNPTNNVFDALLNSDGNIEELLG